MGCDKKRKKGDFGTGCKRANRRRQWGGEVRKVEEVPMPARIDGTGAGRQRGEVGE
ncbi:UNVERIFIED_CONTAM: hypothetical protein Slati_2252300 [Sesamum latifolium]|uniref:Uncharacterized protein n=1 Tax=Sesamum latifolium TaxID=2727402 RepID=A0AAW2WVJ9_9LAMI